MRVYLITGNPGSGKSTLAAELSQRGLIAVDADDLAFCEDNAGVRVDQPPGADDAWRRAHRWVWSRVRMEQVIAASGEAGRVFFCGIARNQDQMLDLFEKVFLLVIDAGIADCPARSPGAGDFAGSQRGDETADPRRPPCLPGPDALQRSDPPGRNRVTEGPCGQPAGLPRPRLVTASLSGSCAGKRGATSSPRQLVFKRALRKLAHRPSRPCGQDRRPDRLTNSVTHN